MGHSRQRSQSFLLEPQDNSQSNVGVSSVKSPIMNKNKDKSLYELIEYLCMNLDQETGILCLLMFIAAIENDDYITTFIRQRTDNFSGYYYPRGIREHPYDIVTNDLRILNATFNYSLKLRSMNLLEYVLKGAEDLFINASVSEDQLLPLLINQYDEVNQQILKFIVTKDVILVNDGSLKFENSVTENNPEDQDEVLMRSSSIHK